MNIHDFGRCDSVWLMVTNKQRLNLLTEISCIYFYVKWSAFTAHPYDTGQTAGPAFLLSDKIDNGNRNTMILFKKNIDLFSME